MTPRRRDSTIENAWKRPIRVRRKDQTSMMRTDKPEPGEYAPYAIMYSGANDRRGEDLLRELATVREATISLYQGLAEEALTRGGIANGSFVTVRALAYHIAGHELHHVNIVRERYL